MERAGAAARVGFVATMLVAGGCERTTRTLGLVGDFGARDLAMRDLASDDDLAVRDAGDGDFAHAPDLAVADLTPVDLTPPCGGCKGATPYCDLARGVCVACLDDANCGAGEVCTATGSCIPGCNALHSNCGDAGVCDVDGGFCDPCNGSAYCSGRCTDSTVDVQNCGSCGHVCAAPTGGSASCVAGACRGLCAGGRALCGAGVNGGGVCRDINNDPNNCGACGHTCDAPSGGVATCANGYCAGACANPLAACGATVNGGGACVDVRSDVSNCGSCGHGCFAPTGGTVACVSGACAGGCPLGQLICGGGTSGGGACVDVRSDASNCAGCGHVCFAPSGGSALCAGSACVGACAPGRQVCSGGSDGGGVCSDLTSDANNCASCGHACTAPTGGSASCIASACAGNCAGGAIVCGGGANGGGTCTNLLTDANHCGSCTATPCASGVCENGQCLYLPAGVQQNVPLSTVTGGGWTQCYSDTYNTKMKTSTVLATCTKNRLLLVCRPTGNATATLLAQGLAADVLFDTGGSNTNTKHVANGIGWYYDANLSWGFAPSSDSINLSPCDTSNSDSGNRLCWNTNNSGGYRCGSNTGLSSSTSWERLVFQAD